jgi:hypothetical protein
MIYMYINALIKYKLFMFRWKTNVIFFLSRSMCRWSFLIFILRRNLTNDKNQNLRRKIDVILVIYTYAKRMRTRRSICSCMCCECDTMCLQQNQTKLKTWQIIIKKSRGKLPASLFFFFSLSHSLFLLVLSLPHLNILYIHSFLLVVIE